MIGILQRQMVHAMNRRKTKGWKDTAMLYVFNNADTVQIAWNNVLPVQKTNEKRRFGGLRNFVRTLSAG